MTPLVWVGSHGWGPIHAMDHALVRDEPPRMEVVERRDGWIERLDAHDGDAQLVQRRAERCRHVHGVAEQKDEIARAVLAHAYGGGESEQLGPL